MPPRCLSPGGDTHGRLGAVFRFKLAPIRGPGRNCHPLGFQPAQGQPKESSSRQSGRQARITERLTAPRHQGCTGERGVTGSSTVSVEVQILVVGSSQRGGCSLGRHRRALQPTRWTLPSVSSLRRDRKRSPPGRLETAHPVWPRQRFPSAGRLGCVVLERGEYATMASVSARRLPCMLLVKDSIVASSSSSASHARPEAVCVTHAGVALSCGFAGGRCWGLASSLSRVEVSRSCGVAMAGVATVPLVDDRSAA